MRKVKTTKNTERGQWGDVACPWRCLAQAGRAEAWSTQIVVELYSFLLVAKGISTRSKDATSSSWPYY